MTAETTAIEQWPIGRFLPYARNPRKNDAAVDQMAASIREFGFKIPILAKSDGAVVDGHLRLKAAHKLQLTELPVILCDEWTDAQVKAFRLIVNRSVTWAEWDNELLAAEMQDLKELDFNLSLTGFDEAEIERLLEDGTLEAEGNYSRKIESPVYEPRGEKPPVAELYSNAKAEQLIAEIDAADLPPEVARFLELAAYRHTVFDFARVADFYAHSDAAVQRLMERSALVIIDFNQAIENGFVELTEHLGELAAQAANSDA
jgi:ParB-like nuclease family protein